MKHDEARQAEQDAIDAEVWKSIPSWPNYEASNLGRVRSIERVYEGERQRYRRPATILVTMQQKGRQYRRVNVYRDGKMYQRGVHRLVLEAFEGPSELVVNHIDGNQANNCLDNLEYCTPAENAKHAAKIGLLKGMKGESNGAAKLTENQVRQIRKEHVPYRVSCSKLAKKYNVCEQTIAKIVRRELWTHV